MYMKVSNEQQLLTLPLFFPVFSLINKLITVFETILTGPHLISFRPHARNVPLQASMTVTDG